MHTSRPFDCRNRILLGALLFAAGCASRRSVQSEPLAEFDASVEEYVELRQQAVIGAGRLTPAESSAVLVSDQTDLAIAIQRLRTRLPQGVLFTPPVAHYIQRTLRQRLSNSDGAALLAAIRDVKPAPVFVPRVNERYPDDLPRTAMPPAVLAVLPQLPPHLVYRFMNRQLLLLDRDTGVIVDVLPDALPETDAPSG